MQGTHVPTTAPQKLKEMQAGMMSKSQFLNADAIEVDICGNKLMVTRPTHPTPWRCSV